MNELLEIIGEENKTMTKYYVKVEKIHEDAILPTRKHPHDAGMDFYADGDFVIEPHKMKHVTTGIRINLNAHKVFGLLKPKGKNNYLVGAGVLDEDYRGELIFKVFNPTDEKLIIRYGQAVGQVVVMPCLYPDIVEEAVVDDTVRGGTGGIITEMKKEQGT